jgi:hypothetical protein
MYSDTFQKKEEKRLLKSDRKNMPKEQAFRTAQADKELLKAKPRA